MPKRLPGNLTDPQDPLPEASWLWRRVFTFTALALAFAVAIGLSYAVNRIVGNIVGRIDSMDAVSVARITVVALNVILDMFRMMFWTVITVTLFYMVAPSAEQITKMIQTARLLRGGVQVASRARYEAPDRTEETQATVGLPPQPAVPPADPEQPETIPDAPWAATPPPPPHKG